jgi:hypothetical protein
LINGERWLAGLVLDRYDKTLVLKLTRRRGCQMAEVVELIRPRLAERAF